MADLQKTKVNIDERIKQIEAKIKNPEKLRMTIEKFSNSLNSLINRLEKGDLVSLRLFASQGASEKDILVRNMVSNLDKTRRRAKIKCLHFIFRDDEVFSRREINAQKRVIFEIKSPFNLRLEPEFSTGSPVGDPGGTRTHDTKLKRLVL